MFLNNNDTNGKNIIVLVKYIVLQDDFKFCKKNIFKNANPF